MTLTATTATRSLLSPLCIPDWWSSTEGLGEHAGTWECQRFLFGNSLPSTSVCLYFRRQDIYHRMQVFLWQPSEIAPRIYKAAHTPQCTPFADSDCRSFTALKQLSCLITNPWAVGISCSYKAPPLMRCSQKIVTDFTASVKAGLGSPEMTPVL